MAATEATSDVSRASAAGQARPVAAPLAALSLALKGAALLAAAFGTALAITLLVPEGNDYAEAARIQHHALTAPAGRKIVLVGGSNLAFGIDSPMIEAATGCPVANMGINGYLGVRFMLRQVEPHVRSGDVVVLAFEHDSFFKSVDGTPSDQVAVVKAAPATLAYYTWKQRWRQLEAVPFVAQQKILRLMGRAYDRVADPTALEPGLIHSIETVAGVTPNGDLVSHLGVDWPYDLEDGYDATTLPLDGEIIGLLQRFGARMDERGVRVVMSYTPVLRDYYERHRASLERIHALLGQAPPLVAPSPPRGYVYDRPLFFDTVYHLNAEGRALRTERLIDDLDRSLGDAGRCDRPADSQGGLAE